MKIIEINQYWEHCRDHGGFIIDLDNPKLSQEFVEVVNQGLKSEFKTTGCSCDIWEDVEEILLEIDLPYPQTIEDRIDLYVD